MTRTRRRLVALAALVLLGAGVAAGTHDLTATHATTPMASTYYDLSPTHH